MESPHPEVPALLPATRQSAAIECTCVWLGLPPGQNSRTDSSPPLPCPLPGLPGGGRAGGGRVRLLCLCKSICWWCIYGPVYVFLCDYQAQLSMAPLWLGLSLFICSMSRRLHSLSALRQPQRPLAAGCFAGSCVGWRLPCPPAHLHGVCVGAPLASWAPCVSLSPGPRVSCVCESEFGCWWLTELLPGGARR